MQRTIQSGQMTLTETLLAAGMTPPKSIVPERWLRFPGIGKGRSNRAGWCRLIAPTLAIYGDWSSNFSAVWKDESHRDDDETRRLLADAREREQRFAAMQREQQRKACGEAERMIQSAVPSHHPYLTRKGFPEAVGLVKAEKLLVPMWDVNSYRRLLSFQEISADGEKRFLAGSRTKGAVYRIGTAYARRTALCEGYATGLTIDAALSRLNASRSVVVCFSAMNLVAVAPQFPGAVVCADNDESKTGEEAAQKTGLPWCMPPQVGTDFNDLHQQRGLTAVIDVIRRAWSIEGRPPNDLA